MRGAAGAQASEGSALYRALGTLAWHARLGTRSGGRRRRPFAGRPSVAAPNRAD
jgi:hypothetical protein